jgi:hypothetical protein
MNSFVEVSDWVPEYIIDHVPDYQSSSQGAAISDRPSIGVFRQCARISEKIWQISALVSFCHIPFAFASRCF